MTTDEDVRTVAESGRRDTRQRRAVRDYMYSHEYFVSAKQIHDDIRAAGESIGLATIYRNLQAMYEAEELDSIRTDDGEVLYRRCGTRHHHHLVCRSCGLTVEVSGPGVERWAANAAETNGFTDVQHVVELFGLCADCSKPGR